MVRTKFKHEDPDMSIALLQHLTAVQQSATFCGAGECDIGQPYRAPLPCWCQCARLMPCLRLAGIVLNAQHRTQTNDPLATNIFSMEESFFAWRRDRSLGVLSIMHALKTRRCRSKLKSNRVASQFNISPGATWQSSSSNHGPQVVD